MRISLIIASGGAAAPAWPSLRGGGNLSQGLNQEQGS